MSTKIYEAYRFPEKYLNDALDLFRDQMLKKAASEIKKFMLYVQEDALKKHMDDKKWHPYDKATEKQKMQARFDMIMEMAKEASKKMEKDPFCLDCGLNIWHHKKYCYIIPIYCNGTLLKGLKKPEWLKDFSYWDNVDPPKGISWAQFSKRGEVWEQINCGTGRASHNARRMYHSILDLGNHFSTDELELMYKVLPNEK